MLAIKMLAKANGKVLKRMAWNQASLLLDKKISTGNEINRSDNLVWKTVKPIGVIQIPPIGLSADRRI